MTFNPQNIQLVRIIENFKRHKFLYFKDSRSIIGRSSASDHILSSNKCSNKHSEIFFRDGNIFVKDLGSLNGTFVQNQKIPPHEEVQLYENDVVGFGVCPNKVDTNDRKNFIYLVKKAEIVDILESSDEDEEEISINCGFSNNNVPNESAKEFEAVSHSIDIEDEIEGQAQESDDNESFSPQFVLLSPISAKQTNQLDKKDIEQKQKDLRRWNQNGVKLIDAHHIRRNRERRASTFGVPKIESSPQPVRLRRPKKSEEERKEKLKKLAGSNPHTKQVLKKPMRGVKVKNTMKTRGDLLVQSLPSTSA